MHEPTVHQISLTQVDPDALKVVQILQKAGHVAYIVGGGVRDLLLGKNPKDYDISTSAKPEEVKAIFRSHCILIGRRFRLAHIRLGKKVFEVSTFRAGGNESDQLIFRDNVWGTPEEDVLRRDFTMNGLFYDPTKETVIDYVGGFADLRKNYLRTIGQPFLRFKQDPVRMIRLIKFQARFGFDIDPEAKIALAECRLEIMKSSQARVLEEILRMLESGSSAPFLKLMSETGFLEHLMPALANFLETREGSEVFSYLQEVDTRKETLHRATLLACLLFPFIQKRIKTHFLDRDKIPHLGDILQETTNAIHAIFQPFFLLPRRLKMGIGSIVTAQYRMTPIEAKHSRRIRIPRDADFPLALEFLSLRTCLEPALIETGAAWKKAYEETHIHYRRRK